MYDAWVQICNVSVDLEEEVDIKRFFCVVWWGINLTGFWLLVYCWYAPS
jgi:hypothetical protein